MMDRLMTGVFLVCVLILLLIGVVETMKAKTENEPHCRVAQCERFCPCGKEAIE